MVRKRKKQEEELIWCFFCERTFKDENDLILHQKQKHFKCQVCSKRLGNIKALTVHSLQVHKVTVTAVPDALPNREDPSWDILGMAGVPLGMKPGDETPKPGEASLPPTAPHVPFPPGPPMAMVPPPYGMAPPPYGAPPPHFAGPGVPRGYGMPRPPPPGMQMLPYHQGMPPFHRPPYPGAPPMPYRPGPPVHSMPMPMPMPPRSGPPGMVPYNPAYPPHLGARPPAGELPAVRPTITQQVAAPNVIAASATPPSSVVSAGPVPAAPSAAQAGPPPEATQPPPVAAKAAEPVQRASLVWSDEDVSVEERRASLPKYQQTPAKKNE